FLVALVLPPMKFVLFLKAGFFWQETLLSIVLFFTATFALYGLLKLLFHTRTEPYLLTLCIAILFFISPSIFLNLLVKTAGIPLLAGHLALLGIAISVVLGLIWLMKHRLKDCRIIYSVFKILLHVYVLVPLCLISYALIVYEPYDVEKA